MHEPTTDALVKATEKCYDEIQEKLNAAQRKKLVGIWNAETGEIEES